MENAASTPQHMESIHHMQIVCTEYTVKRIKQSIMFRYFIIHNADKSLQQAGIGNSDFNRKTWQSVNSQLKCQWNAHQSVRNVD